MFIHFFFFLKIKKQFLQMGGIYYLSKNDNNEFSLVDGKADFDNLMQSTQETDNFYKLLDDAGEYSYIFPILQTRTIFRHKVRGRFSDTCYDPFYKLSSDSKVEDSSYEDTIIIMSFLDRDSQKGTLVFLDSIKGTRNDGAMQTSSSISSSGIFSCKRFFSIDYIICAYAANEATIYYHQTKRELNDLGTRKVLYTLSSGSDVFKAAKKIEAGNKGIGIACTSPSNIYFLFDFALTTTQITIDQTITTTLKCSDYLGMNLMKIFDNYILITGFDGSYTQCTFYNYDLDKLSLDNKDICAYKEMRVSMIDNFLYFLYTKDDPAYVYYLEYEIIKCLERTYDLATNDPIIIDILDLIEPGVLSNPTREDIGIVLAQSDTNSILGIMHEVDDNGNVLSLVILNNYNKFYQRIKYVPEIYGTNRYDVKIYAEVTDEFIVPVPSCQLTLVNSCYETCRTCSYVGNEIDHKCNECVTNAHFLDGTQNCLFVPPPGYYLDQIAWVYKKCGDNCYSCEDETKCLLCDEDYSLYSSYTLVDSDAFCVPTCELSNSRWYLNEENNNEFSCFNGRDQCTIDYSCYNTTKKQCKKNNRDNDCEIILPVSISMEELFNYFDKNIRQYYESKLVNTNEEYTAVVYDSSTTSNKASGLTNLTEIELNECEKKLRERYELTNDEPLLIAQVDSISEEQNSNIPYYSYYSQEGKKLDLAVCENISISIFVPISENKGLTLQSDYIESLSDQGIDVFNINDDFFHNKCVSFSSTNDTDVPMNDRRNEYYQNVSLCGEGCQYSGINTETHMAKCSCRLQNSGFASNMGKEIFNIFKSSITEGNFIVIVCYNLVFNMKILVQNLGSYMMIG